MDVDRLEFDAKPPCNFGHALWTLRTACRRIIEYAKALGVWKELFEYFDFLRVELSRKDADACHIATRPRQAGGKPRVYEIVADTDDRNRFGRSLCRAPGRFSKGKDHGSAIAHERCGEPW